MAEIVNLHRVRKRAARTKQQDEAQANRGKFGRTRSERMRDEQQTARAKATLDQHRLDDER